MDEFKKNLKDSTGFRVFIYLLALLVCALVGGAVTMLTTVNGDIVWLKIGSSSRSFPVKVEWFCMPCFSIINGETKKFVFYCHPRRFIIDSTSKCNTVVQR